MSKRKKAIPVEKGKNKKERATRMKKRKSILIAHIVRKLHTLKVTAGQTECEVLCLQSNVACRKGL